ncbi:MAG: phenylalanine--tRNA ligase subunit beta, partial [Dehalococcoidales bacterium]|nr:phenylalanine--tRNA ligase subunit beta [Dehalococcoidales bacterium]
MKVPLKWLREYTDVTLPAEELAKRLTAAGFEVAGITRSGGSWENVVIGEIKAISPHPNADRLHLATVDLGGEEETVVCGAPNLHLGDKVPFARPGARLINPYTGKTEELKPAKIRGVLSRGMICSEKELGISENHEGIMVLGSDAKAGMPLAAYLGDIVFDIEVTANRPDCLSVVGIAREVAALTGQKVHIAEPHYEETDRPIAEYASVEILAPELCPRYCATLITGVKIKESPPWLQERLIACGQRPINNVVDVTNYVMLEYGQPLHSFDYERLRGGKVIVRRAREGEVLVTLDGVARDLTGDMLVIADYDRAVALAGVMGGQNSEVTEGTTAILLEAASFAAACIHRTSRRLGLVSEASTRFERGISPELTIPALRHATQLIAELGGGKVARGLIDIYPGRKPPRSIRLTPQAVRRILGMEVTVQEIARLLGLLGFVCEVGGEQVTAGTPYWRSDIRQDVDLIEEIARLIGYEKIP